MEVYKEIKKDIANIIGLLLVVYLLISVFDVGVDNTDEDGFNRSGMILHTDYGTGLQYLSRGDKLIPRVDIDGNHMKAQR